MLHVKIDQKNEIHYSPILFFLFYLIKSVWYKKIICLGLLLQFLLYWHQLPYLSLQAKLP